jgi:hypothetical protein
VLTSIGGNSLLFSGNKIACRFRAGVMKAWNLLSSDILDFLEGIGLTDVARFRVS